MVSSPVLGMASTLLRASFNTRCTGLLCQRILAVPSRTAKLPWTDERRRVRYIHTSSARSKDVAAIQEAVKVLTSSSEPLKPSEQKKALEHLDPHDRKTARKEAKLAIRKKRKEGRLPASERRLQAGEVVPPGLTRKQARRLEKQAKEAEKAAARKRSRRNVNLPLDPLQSPSALELREVDGFLSLGLAPWSASSKSDELDGLPDSNAAVLNPARNRHPADTPIEKGDDPTGLNAVDFLERYSRHITAIQRAREFGADKELRDSEEPHNKRGRIGLDKIDDSTKSRPDSFDSRPPRSDSDDSVPLNFPIQRLSNEAEDLPDSEGARARGTANRTANTVPAKRKGPRPPSSE